MDQVYIPKILLFNEGETALFYMFKLQKWVKCLIQVKDLNT